MTTGYTLRIPGRPPTTNGERAGHWRDHRTTTRAYRLQACQKAKRLRVPRLDVVQIRSFPTYLDRRSWPDVAAWHGATKAVVDGLVDAHVLPGDTWEHVRRIVFDAPRLGDAVELVVQIIPWHEAAT